MDKKKLAIGLIVTAATAGLVWFFSRKTKKELDEREEKIKVIINKSEITEEEILRTESKSPITVGQSIFDGLYGRLEKEELDTGAMNGVDVFYGLYNSVHVQKRFDRRIGKHVVDLIFEIPDTAVPGSQFERRNPCDYLKLRDFQAFIGGVQDNEGHLDGLRGMMEKVLHDIPYGSKRITIKDRFIMECRTESYILIEEEGKESKRGRLVRINSKDLEKNNFQRDADLVNAVLASDDENRVSLNLVLPGDRATGSYDALEAFMAIRLTVVLQSSDNLIGATEKSIIESLYQIMTNEDFYICDVRNDVKTPVFNYNGIIVHTDQDKDDTCTVVFSKEGDKTVIKNIG